MTWLTWRQLRASAALALVLLAAVVVVLLVTGPRLSEMLRTTGDAFFDALDNDDALEAVLVLGTRLVWLVPVLVGVFWGAPMVARELEARTHRLVWTQSITPTRWLANKLAVTSVAAAVVGLVGLALTWWCRPLDKAVAQGLDGRGMGSIPRLWPEVFAQRGIVPIGMAVLALTIGVAAGLFVRRTVPAMALTLAVVILVQLILPILVQPRLLGTDRTVVTYTVDAITEFQIDGPPRIEDDPDADVHVVEFAVRIDKPGAWVVHRDMIDSEGDVVTRIPDWVSDCAPHPGSDPQVVAACFQRLEDDGYRQRVDYLPASRFWALQAAETGFLLVLSALVAGLCFWRIRRDLT